MPHGAASGLSGAAARQWNQHRDICGLAINICCFFAARDLRNAGFNVHMVEDASAGIDVPAAGLFQDKAKKEAEQMGIRYVTTAETLAMIRKNR